MVRSLRVARACLGALLLFACGEEAAPPPPEGLTITTLSLRSGKVGVAYDEMLLVKNGVGSSYDWTLEAGALPRGLALSPSGTPGRLSGTPEAPGRYLFIVAVVDGSGARAERSLALEIEPEDLIPVEITTTELPDGTATLPYSATLSGTGGNGGPYLWELAAGVLPAGLSLSSEGTLAATIAGTPVESGSFTIVVRLADVRGQEVERTFTFEIDLEPMDLQIVTAMLPGGFIGTAYSEALVALGGTRSGYMWSVIDGTLPLGFSLSAAGVVSGTTPELGTWTFTVQVADDGGATAQQVLSLEIAPVGPELQILTEMLSDGRSGRPYDRPLQGSGGSNSGYRWTVVQGSLPPGLTLGAMGTPATTLSGTPQSEGDFSFTVQLRDSVGQTAERALTLHLEPAVPVVRIVTMTLPGGPVGQPYDATLTAADGFGDYRWSVTAGALPQGLTLTSSGTPSVQLSGTPAQVGTFNVTITVTDRNNETASQAYMLVIGPPTVPLGFVTTMLPNAGIGGEPYEEEVVANGGSNAGYTWTVTVGNLPPGLILAPMGTPATTLSGMPTTQGPYFFTIQVTDSIGGVATRMFNVNVGPALLFDTATLPGGTVGVFYNQQIFGTGGTRAGYSWTLVGGALPPGLVVQPTGTPATNFTGTPTAAGEYTFTLELRDSGNNTIRRTFTVTIAP